MMFMAESNLCADYEAAVIRWLAGWAALFAAMACKRFGWQGPARRLAEYAGRTPALP